MEPATLPPRHSSIIDLELLSELSLGHALEETRPAAGEWDHFGGRHGGYLGAISLPGH